MKVKERVFGTLSSGQEVGLFALKNGNMTACVSALGGTLASILLPRGKDAYDDVALGFSTLDGYMRPHPFFGVTVGRFANRIGGASFALDGKTYSLLKNDGENSLHSGRRGFDKALWKAEPFSDRRSVGVRLTYKSPDGDEGFPGNLDCEVVYALNQDNELSIRFRARTDAPTPVNMTNHSYFNLRGEGTGDILGHELTMYCSQYLPVEKGNIPTGEIAAVKGTPLDFTKPKAISEDIAKMGLGYDHCLVVDRTGRKLSPVAKVVEHETKRSMRVLSSQPGVQLYTGNYLEAIQGKNGSVYGKHSGFCLETQHFPDSVNKPAFPNCIVRPGDEYDETCVYCFDF
jgi:aldose 1-epimerase